MTVRPQVQTLYKSDNFKVWREKFNEAKVLLDDITKSLGADQSLLPTNDKTIIGAIVEEYDRLTKTMNYIGFGLENQLIDVYDPKVALWTGSIIDTIHNIHTDYSVKIGNIGTITTDAKTVVTSLNELHREIGRVEELKTSTKNLTGSVNQIFDEMAYSEVLLTNNKRVKSALNELHKYIGYNDFSKHLKDPRRKSNIIDQFNKLYEDAVEQNTRLSLIEENIKQIESYIEENRRQVHSNDRDINTLREGVEDNKDGINAILDTLSFEDIYITKSRPWITLDSASSGSNNVEQAAGISIGESGQGSASIHMTYTGNGWSHIGMGNIGNDSIPDNCAMQLYYKDKDVRFMGNTHVKGYHYVNTNDGSLRIGSANDSWTHFVADRNFWFNRDAQVDGEFRIYRTQNYMNKNGIYLNNQHLDNRFLKRTEGVDPSLITGTKLWYPFGKNVTHESHILEYNDHNPKINNSQFAGTVSFKADSSDAALIKTKGVHVTHHVQSKEGFYIGDSHKDGIKVIDSEGNFFSGSTISVKSDENLKENITDLENKKCLEIVNTIKPKSYNFKSDSNKTKSYGVIAQDIEKVLPELVIEENDIKNVKYIELISILIGSVKELSERIEKLEKE